MWSIVKSTIRLRNAMFFIGYRACRSHLRGLNYIANKLDLDAWTAYELSYWLIDELDQCALLGKDYCGYRCPWEILYHQGVIRIRGKKKRRNRRRRRK